jgi:iron complex outermembrane receptor protein
MHRAFKAIGAEALAPPVDQNAMAVFGLEQIEFERVRIQLGGRLEHNRYSPAGLQERSFTGFSGAAGVHVPLWRGGAAVANYTRAFRAPALEELYNRGPHLGNLTFEVGNPLLKREQSDGIDLSLRHRSERFRGEINLFRYSINDFIYLAPTGHIEDGLLEADYAQADARYMGAEARAEVQMHTNLWLLLGFDAVDAQLRETKTPLPRIPPVRGRVGLDVRAGNLSVRPELVLANHQHQLFPTETQTPGYGVVNLNASYTRATQHAIHVFAVNLFNANDKLYRNHLSFIKDVAPEIGRGIRFTYTLRFF